MNQLFSTTIHEKWGSLGLLWLRLLMGAGMAYHGYGKLFQGSVAQFGEFIAGMGLPFPHLLAWIAVLSEFLGGLCIMAGLGTRVAAFFVFGTMTIAVFVAHGADPFTKKELALAYWTIAGTLMMTGPGFLSVDRLFFHKSSHSS